MPRSSATGFLFRSVVSVVFVVFFTVEARAEPLGGEVFVTCPRGGNIHGANTFCFITHRDSPSIPELFPRCFSVGPDGMFYFPEVAIWAGIQVHLFRPDGKFKVMWNVLTSPATRGGKDYQWDAAAGEFKPLFGTALAVHHAGVSKDGALYLAVKRSGDAGLIVNKYRSDGKFLYHVGRSGMLTPESIGDEKSSRARRDSFFTWVAGLYVTSQGELVMQEGADDSPTVYRFDSSGKLLEKGKAFPEEIARHVAAHNTAYAKLVEAFKAANQKPPEKFYTVRAPDGRFYYMTFDDKKLEIRGVTFPGE